MNKTYLKALFDIQTVHIDGSAKYYAVYYKQDHQYVKVIDTQFNTRADAQGYIDDLLDL